MLCRATNLKYRSFFFIKMSSFRRANQARLAQLVERKALNLVVVGSSPTVGVHAFFSLLPSFLIKGCLTAQLRCLGVPVPLPRHLLSFLFVIKKTRKVTHLSFELESVLL